MFHKLVLILSLLFLVSCQQGEGGQPVFSDKTLPDSNGGRLDVLVVAKDGIWEDIAGETLRKYVTRAQPGLPQPEPMFTVRQVEPHQFNELLKRARNLIILEIGEGGYNLTKRKYAKPQLFFRFSAANEEALGTLIAKHNEELVETIRQSEVDYLQKRLTAKHQEVPEMLQKRHVDLEIPRDYELENSNDSVLVYWKKGMESDQGIIIHFEALADNDAVIGDRIIPLRDSLTRQYIRGEKEGTYMKVEDLIPPTFENRELDGHFTIETRGLWRTVNDLMGGAFVNYTVFDETNNQRIMLDGFVYGPGLKKRNLLLEMEAILQTFETTN